MMDYLKIYNTIDSTNKEAHRLLAEGPVQDGCTLLAIHQTDGKGQLGRSWLAEPGKHLSMTIIHQPQLLPATDLPFLGMKVSLGIVKALHAIDNALIPLIKWPNDIYIHGKKLCGILIENSLTGARVQHSVIGIGMNVNETQFPAQLPNAISLLLIAGKEYHIEWIARKIRDEIMSSLHMTSTHWKEEYDLFVFGKGQSFRFESGGHSFPAIVIGVSLEGKLILQLEDGKTVFFSTHEVKWLL